MSHRLQFNFQKAVPRRLMLQGAGVALAMPWLSAMQPAFAKQAEPTSPKRFVALTLGLGLVSENLNPVQSGFDYQPSLYLKPLMDLKHKFTVVSGSSHPGVGGGHRAEASILTANPVGSSGRAKNSISIDQLMAKYYGNETRFSSLVLSSNGSNSPSYTENGAMIPALDSPAQLFTQLFINDSPQQQKIYAAQAQQGKSIMDLVQDDAKRLAKKLGKGDQDRLDAFYTSVRALENQLAETKTWATKPKPDVPVSKPNDIGNPNDFIGRQRLMSDMIALALQTDSTRFISYHLGGSGGVVPLAGVAEGYHSLSHHGKDEEKLDQLALVEEEIINAYGDFLRTLNTAVDGEHNLLDQTAVLLTSNLGNASSHDNKNMPVILAGGGFRHGQHLAFDRNNNYPLTNLYLNLLQRQGFEMDRFMSSTGTMTGLT